MVEILPHAPLGVVARVHHPLCLAAPHRANQDRSEIVGVNMIGENVVARPQGRRAALQTRDRETVCRVNARNSHDRGPPGGSGVLGVPPRGARARRRWRPAAARSGGQPPANRTRMGRRTAEGAYRRLGIHAALSAWRTRLRRAGLIYERTATVAVHAAGARVDQHATGGSWQVRQGPLPPLGYNDGLRRTCQRRAQTARAQV